MKRDKEFKNQLTIEDYEIKQEAIDLVNEINRRAIYSAIGKDCDIFGGFVCDSWHKLDKDETARNYVCLTLAGARNCAKMMAILDNMS